MHQIKAILFLHARKCSEHFMCINSIFTISSLRLILSIPILTMWKQSNKEAKNLAQRFTEPRLVGVQIPRESREKHKVPLVAAIFTRTMASKNFWKPVSSCLAFHRIFAFDFHFKEVSHSLNFITLLEKAVDGMRISLHTGKLKSRLLNFSFNDAL